MSGIITQTLTLEKVSDEREGTTQTGKQWTSNDLVFTGEFDKKIAITAFNLETSAEPGRTYIVRFTIESREYNGKWYTNAKLKSMEPVQAPEMVVERPAVPELLPHGTAVQAHLLPPTTANQAVQRSRQRSEQLAATQDDDLPF